MRNRNIRSSDATTGVCIEGSKVTCKTKLPQVFANCSSNFVRFENLGERQPVWLLRCYGLRHVCASFAFYDQGSSGPKMALLCMIAAW